MFARQVPQYFQLSSVKADRIENFPNVLKTFSLKKKVKYVPIEYEHVRTSHAGSL